MAEVVLENVSRVYGRGAPAVDRVSLSVHDKEFVVLVGPSGCGKSTTLRMIAGLEEISSGQIRIGGRVVNQVPPKDRDIAMVFQNYALYPHMSVYKNMAFGLELRQGAFLLKRWWWRVFRPRKAADAAQRRYQIAEQVHRAAQTLGIEHLLERMPRHLSGGERQRVALGRAIVRQPAAFLFDEPLSNLDAKLRVDMRRELKQLHRHLEATVIYVTHDQVEALTLGQRIVVMNRGVVQQVGAPLDVYDRPANQFVAGFIGAPPMSFIRGELKGIDGEPRFVQGDWSLTLDVELAQSLRRHLGKQLVLGIRPEDVQVSEIEDSTNGAVGRQGFAATVALVEPLGDATLLNLEIAADARGSAEKNPTSFHVLSKIGARSVAVVGQQVKANLDLRRAHWFDSATGDNLHFGN